MSISIAALTFEQKLQSQINTLIGSKTGINNNYNLQITKVIGDFNTNQINSSEKDAQIAQLNSSRTSELNNIDNEVSTLQTQKSNVSNDPYKNVTQQQTSTKSTVNSSLKDVTGFNSKLVLEMSAKIAGNLTKSLVPSLALRLTSQLTGIGTQNKKIEELVDSVNTVIDSIKTQTDITKATTLRSGAINTINSNEQKILSIKSIFTQLQTFLTIFNLLITVLSSLPVPVGAPIGVGLPMSIILGVAKNIENANKLVLGLNVIIGICIPVLTRMVSDLEVQKARLETINGLLDQATTSTLDNDQLSQFLAGLTQNTTDLGTYKGFQFVLKEEENPSFIVDGFKRHYAVAINSDGNIVLQSEYSFTLDPSVLVSQLKLQIDSSGITS